MDLKLDWNKVDELRVKVATGCRILGKLKLADYLGHVSARVPGTDYVLIKARGTDEGSLEKTTPDKIVLVDMDANLVQGNYRPPSETAMHTEVYRARPDVMSVVHTHQPISTAFGIAGKQILPMITILASVARKPLPTYPSSIKISDKKRGQEMAKILGNSVAMFLRHHGVLVTGRSVEEAVVNTIWLEDQAYVTLLATLLGNPVPMPDDQIETQIREAADISGRWRYYVSLLDE